jgi:predicted amidophosphoribosyltransferase
MLRDQAQKGDRVTISRGGHGATAKTSADTLAVCAGCNHKLAVGAAYCDSCGRPVGANSEQESS